MSWGAKGWTRFLLFVNWDLTSCVCCVWGTLRNDNELNHYYTKVHTVILVGLPETADIAAITEKCEAFGAVSSVRRPEVR